MQPTETQISVALAHYRERIVSHNREAFTKLVQMTETSRSNTPKSAEVMAAARLCFIRGLLGITRPELHQSPAERIECPADVRRKWPELVRIFALDGVTVGRDDAKREADRSAYRDGIMAGLRVLDGGDAARLGFPDNLWSLMGLVDSLEGHGWPQYREHGQQVRFWNGLGASAVEVEERCVDPVELDLEGWEVLAGWECGSGLETICYVLYCRAEEDEVGLSVSEEEDDGGDTSWKWRYVADMGQNGMEVFDSIVELLKWYEELHVPDLEHLDWYTDKVFSD
ncbi:hypothetical protein PG999_007433 [Apiospora kogelbergensis]|uniref:Uncharacterized protein n=1 Tax=Apiospora kogelbergensis TaxID=1337665 RepID=A0AAW0QY94_9PEZI